jgi:competence protein ComEC
MTAMAFAAGIALSHAMWITPGWLLVAGVAPLILICLVTRNESRVVLLPLFAAWMLLGVFVSEVQPLADPQSALIGMEDGKKHKVLGEVVGIGAVRTIESQRPFTNQPLREQQLSVQLAVRSVDAHAVTGGVRVAVYAPMNVDIAPLRCGDRMTVDTELKQPQLYRDPGVWNGRAWLLGQGVSVLAAAGAMEIPLPVHAKHGSLGCWIDALQVRASEQLVSLGAGPDAAWMPSWLRLTERDAGMLTAMVTGDRSYLERGERLGFERTGAFHVLVVSGLHVGLIAALLLAGTKKLGCSRGWSAFITALLAAVYAVFTGFGAPVQRALAMVLLYLAARALYRGRDAMHALGVAALCLLAWEPSALFEAGLQMTILTVVATVGLVAPMAERSFRPYLVATRQLSIVAIDAALPPRLAQFRVMMRLAAENLRPCVPGRLQKRTQTAVAFAVHMFLRGVELLVMSVTVEVVMALPMALYFHRVTVLALPVNLLLIPGLGILLPVAVMTAATAWCGTAIGLPHLAAIPGALLAVLMHLASGIVQFFSHVEAGDVRVATPSLAHIFLVLLALGCSIWALRRHRTLALGSATACTVAIAMLLWPNGVAARPRVLEIGALDVGQGDALLVITPEGKTLMVDCGGPTGGDMTQHGNFEIGEDVVSPVLWSRGVSRLDAVVLSHAHSDHMGGMFAVLGNFHPQELWVGNNPATREYTALLAEAEHLHIAVHRFHAGDAFNYGGMEVRVLAPASDYLPGPTAKNDDSLVLRVAYRRTSALLEGDAEAASEGSMAKLPSIHADLLKVGHHGSKTSTTQVFLRAVSPHYAVVSVGLHNLYHHPRFETLEHLEEAGVRTYRTDLDGMSTFYLDGERVSSFP